jgi:hypothetical protein
MEYRFTFRMVAKLFLVEDIDYEGYETMRMEVPTYSQVDVDLYIADHEPYKDIMSDICHRYDCDTPLNKCLQSLDYNSRTRTITATLQILTVPDTYPFVGETLNDYANNLKEKILSIYFEDGCWGGEDCIFHVKDEPLGFFDIRDPKTLHVEFVSLARGPTREEYEASWKPAADVLTKIPYSEALKEFCRCIALKDGVERNDLIRSYFKDHEGRGIYGLVNIYHQLLERPFYKMNIERMAAFKRIMGFTQ